MSHLLRIISPKFQKSSDNYSCNDNVGHFCWQNGQAPPFNRAISFLDSPLFSYKREYLGEKRRGVFGREEEEKELVLEKKAFLEFWELFLEKKKKKV